MKVRSSFFLLTAFVLVWTLPGCMQPVDGDFGGKNQGLRDQELLWVLQLPATDSVAPNQDFFRDAVPAMVRDVINGNLPAYEDFTMNTEPQLVRNIGERLKQFGGSKKDISPLSQVVELICLVDLEQPAGHGKPAFLRLIWRDPAGLQADLNFAGIRLEDLKKRGYLVGTGPAAVELSQWLREANFAYQPIYLRTNAREYTVRAPAEAEYLRQHVVEGAWEKIDWVEYGVNISGKQAQPTSPDKILNFSGLYIFPAADSSAEPRELFLTAEVDYLIGEWPHRYRLEQIMYSGDSSFFSNSGELYHFSQDGDSSMQVQVIQDGDTLFGTKKM